MHEYAVSMQAGFGQLKFSPRNRVEAGGGGMVRIFRRSLILPLVIKSPDGRYKFHLPLLLYSHHSSETEILPPSILGSRHTFIITPPCLATDTGLMD